MKDPTSHPVTALLRLAAPPEAPWHCDAAQGVGWLHDVGHPPNAEHLISLATLWHVCSLLQPNLDLRFQRHVVRAGLQAVTVFFTTNTTGWLGRGARGPSSDLGLVGVERLAAEAAWLSHPMHVPAAALTSPVSSDQAQVWLCSDSVLAVHPEGSVDSDAGLMVARAYVSYMQDTGGGGGGEGERILDAPDGVPGGWSNVGYDNGSSVTVRMDCAMSDSVFLEVRARDGDGRTPWKPRSAVVQNPHEARGVGVVVKALVQQLQGAGASLFLRTMIVCAAALLCFSQSISVLGERPSPFIGCQ
ncbi:hypothetical protein J3R83DRAFT_12884 [Lanmaoa asiatica]|nr:hypothetical protein J3R83DRAFT_12884 [Lanmaoa asiatica]